MLAANGVIHMLEGILLPPTILPILPKHCIQEQHQIVVVSAHRITRAFLTPSALLVYGSSSKRNSLRVSGWAHGGSGVQTQTSQTHLDSPTSPQQFC